MAKKKATMRRRLGIVVGACGLVALLGSGCAASRASFRLAPERSDPVAVASAAPEGKWRVLVEPGGQGSADLRAALVRALQRDPSISKARIGTASEAQAEGFDYALGFDVELEGHGEGLNFLRCFPGFLIGTPSWAPLAWSCELRTDVQPTRGVDRETLAALQRKDGVDMYFTSEGYSTAAYSGWWALAFTPSLAMPLITGIVSAFDSVPHDQFWRRFPRTRTCSRWADGVVREVVAHLAKLSEEAGEPAVSEESTGAATH